MAQWVKASKTEGMRCLVTGVTGYIGGRLVSELLDQGHEVRVLAATLSASLIARG